MSAALIDAVRSITTKTRERAGASLSIAGRPNAPTSSRRISTWSSSSHDGRSQRSGTFTCRSCVACSQNIVELTRTGRRRRRSR
jgi:hypothetical protein